MKFFEEKSNTYIFVLLFILAYVIRLFFMIYFRFDGLYGQDSYAYYEWSSQFISAVTSFHIPPKFYWPVGYFIFSFLMYLLSAGSLDYAAILVSLNSGALLAGVMYLLSFELLKNIFPLAEAKKLSIVSGLIICFSGACIKSGIVIMSDSIGLLLLTCGMLYLLRYYNYSGRYRLALSFSFLSLGAMTRYANALIIIPVLIFVIYLYFKSARKREVIKDLLIASLIAVIVFTPELYYISKYGISYLQYEGAAPTWAAAWSPLNYFRKDFSTFDGTTNYKFWNGIYFISPVFHPLYLSLFGASFITGFIAVIKRKYTAVFIFCISWILVYYLYLAGNPFQSIRYTMSFLPSLICISVIGIGSLRVKQVYKSIFIYTGLSLLLVYAAFDIQRFTDKKNLELEVVAWVQQNVPQSAEVFTFDVTGAVKHYTTANVNEFFNYNPESLRQKLDSTKVEIYFILPEEKLKTQWKGHPVGKTFDELLKNYSPKAVTTTGDYMTIFTLKK